jgi:divalent metal cation (Fe/Co/Zn/Cd) transporter
MTEIDSFSDIKVRTAGADTFISVKVTLNPDMRSGMAHLICDKVESEICKIIERCDVLVHVEPQITRESLK